VSLNPFASTLFGFNFILFYLLIIPRVINNIYVCLCLCLVVDALRCKKPMRNTSKALVFICIACKFQLISIDSVFTASTLVNNCKVEEWIHSYVLRTGHYK